MRMGAERPGDSRPFQMAVVALLLEFVYKHQNEPRCLIALSLCIVCIEEGKSCRVVRFVPATGPSQFLRYTVEMFILIGLKAKSKKRQRGTNHQLAMKWNRPLPPGEISLPVLSCSAV